MAFSRFLAKYLTFFGIYFNLLAVALLLSACQSNELVSYQTPPATMKEAPASYGVANYNYPTAIPGSSTAYGNVDSVQGSVEALPPIPVSQSQTTAQANTGFPKVSAKAAILVNGSGKVLFEKNADTHLPAASTQKLLLAILIAERGNLNAPVTITEADTWAEPTVMGIKAGEVYSRDELLHAVLIRSCNDIARALGRDHSGSEAAFVASLNNKARQIGMTNSYFTNSNGLPSPPGNYSTARDLATLGLTALRYPVIRRITSMRTYTFRMANGSTKTLTNTNQVLKTFPYCTGLKTGTTNAAGKCLISSASYGGKTAVAVLLGGTSPSVWQDSEALLKYGLGL